MSGKAKSSARAPIPPPDRSLGAAIGGSASILGGEKLRQIYSLMLQVRAHVASRAIRLPVSEAVAAACAADLRAEDCIAPLRLQALLLPSANGLGRGGGPETEALLEEARRRRQNGGVAVAFVHCGPSQSEAWRRTLRSAERLKLPILFAVEAGTDRGGLNRGGTNRGSARGRRIQELSQGLRLPVMPVDSQDPVALYRAAHESIKRARRGGGPTLLECWRVARPAVAAHPREAAAGAPREAFLRLERYMKERGLWPAGWKSPMRRPAAAKIKNRR